MKGIINHALKNNPQNQGLPNYSFIADLLQEGFTKQQIYKVLVSLIAFKDSVELFLENFANEKDLKW